MIGVQSTFLQPRKYDGLLLTSGKNGTTESHIAQVADNRNRNILYLFDCLCRHRIKEQEQDFDGILARILVTSEQLRERCDRSYW